MISQRYSAYHSVRENMSKGQKVGDYRTNGDRLKVAEAAEQLQIPLTRCYTLIQRGELPAVRIGERSIRIPKRELERYLLEDRRVVTR